MDRIAATLIGLTAAAYAPVVCAIAPAQAILDDLRQPSAVTVVSVEGRTEVVVAEANRLITVGADQSAVERRTLVDGLTWSPTGMLALGTRVLAVGPDGAATLEVSAEAPTLAPLRSPPVQGGPAVGERWLFAVGDGGLLRGRVEAGRFGDLRPIDPPHAGRVAAIAFSPEGYLVAVAPEQGDSSSEWRLSFHDPAKPSNALAAMPLAGVREPIALAYSTQATPIDRSLYLLDATRGLTRVDAATDDRGLSAAKAAPVAGVDGATAMAFGPSGALFVTAVAGDTSGKLWRYPPGL